MRENLKMKKLKLIEKLKLYLPVSRKAYAEDMSKLAVVIQGLTQSEAQHSQMEMNIIQQLNSSKSKTPESDKEKKKTDERSYYA